MNVSILSILVRRLLSVVPVLVVVALLAFVLLRFSQGDPATQLAGDNATPASIAAIRAQLGLDQPLPVQFLRWSWQ